MTLHAVVYVSSAIRLLDSPDLEVLLVDARAFNEKAGVTGALLYDDGAFFQYFEGPEPGVAEVYERIKRSRLHKGLIELFHRPVEQRQFGEWHMGFSRVPKTQLLQLANARWDKAVGELTQSPAAPLGRHLLLDFWASALRSQQGGLAANMGYRQ